MILIAFLCFLSFLITFFLMRPLVQLLTNNLTLKDNYLGQKVPIALGLALAFGSLPSFLIYIFIYNPNWGYLILFLFYLTLLAGFIDDLIGNSEVKGLKGHLKLLFQKRQLTTGSLKAIIISFVSLYFAVLISKNLCLLFINFFVLIFTTNLFNLLDVRPGRALKVYCFLALILSFIYSQNQYLLFVLSAILAYGSWDLKGYVMLGDTGSNFLGITLAISLVLNSGLTVKFFCFLVLLLLHWYTEKNSLSILIERFSFLHKLDQWGRS